jgi:dTDP-4-amino-4,6-dideoxygalactose transaminase
VDHLGLKANGNSIMAAIGLVQLKKLESDNVYRQSLVELYKSELLNTPNLQFPKTNPKLMSSCHLMQIIVPDRDALIDHLSSKNIDTGVHYRLNTRYSIYSKYSCSIPTAEKFEPMLLSLPLHLRLSQEDVRTVSSVIKDFLS